MKLFLLTLLVASLLSSSAVAQSQNSAQPVEPTMILTGVVYDINGAVIVNRTRVVARNSNGRKYKAATNDEGFYKLELPLGLYKIEVSAPGFCAEQMERFRVINSTHGKMSLDFVLEVAGSHEGCQREIIEPKPNTRKKKSKPIAIIE